MKIFPLLAFRRFLVAFCGIALALAPSLATADGFIIIRPPHPPHHHPEPSPPHRLPMPRPIHPVYLPLEIREHLVTVSIEGQVATTTVDQEFFNPSPQNLEGDYIFPIPDGAQIDKFQMDINGKMQDAELLDAGKARQIYEDIVRQAKDPALLEYAGRGVFRMRIFPIEGNKPKRVKLTYTELLKNDTGLVSYRYPLNTEKFSPVPIKKVEIQVKLNGTAPLASVYSPSHAIDIKRDGDRRAEVTWKEANTRPDQDFQLLYSLSDQPVSLQLLTHKQPGEDGWFLLMASPTMKKDPETAPAPKDIMFVADTSGSMSGEKMNQARKALAFCVENLNDNDRFNIARFSTETELFFKTMMEANAENRQQAQKFIKGLKPIGGTAIGDALEVGLSNNPKDAARPFLLVFLTDGLPTIGERRVDKLIEQVKKKNDKARIFSFGIGSDVNTILLDQIAETSRGFSQYVLANEYLEVKLSSFYGRIQEPVLTDVKINTDGPVRLSKFAPPQFPDLFKGDQLLVTGRYSGTGETEVRLSGKMAGQEKSFTAKVNFEENSSAHPFVPRLWAVRRVAFLLDEIKINGENKEVKDEVVALARQFGIVTPYTAYLILEDERIAGVPLERQRLGGVQESKSVREKAKASWDEFADKDQAKGNAGVANARAQNAMKQAAAPAAAAEYARKEAGAKGADSAVAGSGGGFGGTPGSQIVAQPLDQAQQSLTEAGTQQRWSGGRNFVQNSASQWVDTKTQTMGKVTRRVQFASEEYFKLVTEHPEAAQWLALGRNVLFELKGEVVEIFDI